MTLSDNKKVFGILFFSLFATTTGVGIVVPLLPVYAHDLGAKGVYIGLIFGAFSFSRSFLLPFFGRLSDRKGRKPFIVLGLLAYALVSVAFILSSSVGHLILIRFIQGMASAMIMPVVQAYVGDITPAGREGYAMGLFNTSLFMGLSLGPLAGGLLNDHFSMNASFMSMGLLALTGFTLCLWLLPPTHTEVAFRKQQPPISAGAILTDKAIIGLFVYRFTYTAGIGIIWGFLPVLADLEFHLNSSHIGILVMLGVFVSGVIQVPMGYLADRYSRRAMVVVGGLVSASAVLAYNWARSPAELYAASIVFGLGGGTAMPALMALAVQKGHEARSMGSIIAFLTMGHSLGMMIGALFAGLMMDWFALRNAFIAGGVLQVLGVVVFFFCISRQRSGAS